jgi:hypothetical protein
VVRMARYRSNAACTRLGRPPLAARTHPIAVEHNMFTGRCSPSSHGCWFGSADRRGRRETETVGYSLRAGSPPVPVGIEDSTRPLDPYDTFVLRKGGSCRLTYPNLIMIIFE